MSIEKLRIVVADDHRIWRSGMKADLGDGFWVVAETSDADETIEAVREHEPDLVACDLRMPGGGGIRVADEVGDIASVVILTVSEEEEDLLDALAAGAAGYLVKSMEPMELRIALRRVADGEPVVSPSLASLVLGDFRRRGVTPSGEKLTPLSKREREVLRHVAQGLTYREVGEALFIAEKTVENHVRSILEKVRLNRRTELIRWATKRGLD